MSNIEQALRALRDVAGVDGSFVVDASGALVGRDLPAIFDNELFAEVGPRVARLYDTFQSAGAEMDACLLRYAEHKLYVRKMPSGIIGVLSSVAINLPALRMVVNLVVRRVDPQIAPRALGPGADAMALSGPPPSMASPAARAQATIPPSQVQAPAGVHRNPGEPVFAQDGRDSTLPVSERHVRMYRGRRVDE
jgi:predicted regulator of Ras-like GTPase activity (Roadblock/LC7/MglB family)